MKLLLCLIVISNLFLISYAQPKMNSFSGVIIDNSPQDEQSARMILINNRLFVAIYMNKDDMVSRNDSANTMPGEKDITDQLEFYSPSIEMKLLVNRDNTNKISANTLISDRFISATNLFDLWNPEELEYNIQGNNEPNTDETSWQSLITLPKDSSGYILFTSTKDNDVYIGTTITIRIRNKKTQEVLRVFKLIRKPLTPHKVMEFHYVADQSHDRLLLLKDRWIHEADSVYQNQLKQGKTNLPDSTIYQQDTRLMWFFGRIDKDLPDSSLRFSLQANGKDMVVREGITGHLLLLDNLKAGNDYTLKVWYALQPENAETFHFSLPPYWYNRPGVQIAFLVVIIGFIFLIVKSILKKQNRKNALRLQQAQNAFASVRAQLNPHFVFNALNSIQALMNTNNVDGANNYLSRFSKLLRTSLQPNYQGMVPLSTELELLQQYIELEQLRMPFIYSTQIEPSLDIHAIEIPGMLLQPLAENAIKHGLPGAADPKLTCEVLVEHGNLIIAIKNNGYPPKEKMNNGVGLKIVEEKLEILNRCFPDTNAMYQLSTIDNLTTVTITLHQWLK